jgi:hypothetical protein
LVRRSQRLLGDQATRVDRPIQGGRGDATISAAGERDRDVLPTLRDRAVTYLFLRLRRDMETAQNPEAAVAQADVPATADDEVIEHAAGQQRADLDQFGRTATSSREGVGSGRHGRALVRTVIVTAATRPASDPAVRPMS